ncbi:MAG: prepilin peptidase [Candidatus Binatia bacterium]
MNRVVVATVLAFLAIAGLSDLRSRRISNRLNLGATVIGLWLHFVGGGLDGLCFAAAGWVVGLTLLLLPFAAGLVGGGDVKFTAAAGAFLGYRLLLVGLAAGVLLGGVVGLITLLVRGRAREAFRRLYGDLFSLASGVRPERLSQSAGVETVPYGLLLAIGMAAALIGNGWRVIPWASLWF